MIDGLIEDGHNSHCKSFIVYLASKISTDFDKKKITYSIKGVISLPAKLQSLDSLRYFEAVARHLRYTLAATELCLTHSDVSQKIIQLETRLGYTLFERKIRQIILTSSGDVLYKSVRDALSQIRCTLDELNISEFTSGLNIYCMPSFANRWLMPRLNSFQESFPNININLLAENPAPNFTNEQIDIGIFHGSNDNKSSIHQSQTKAVLAVNRVLIELYWEIGNQILKQQAEEGWGTKVIQQLSKDLKTAFPDMKGLSERNLKYMRQFAQTYSEFEFVQQVVAQIPWGHNCLLMSKLENKITRTWYAKKTIENGWSRNVLSHQIELQLFERQGKVISNFSKTLPEPQSDLVQQALKDRYIFDFLNLEERAKETELEKQLIENISKFLLELGAGFALLS